MKFQAAKPSSPTPSYGSYYIKPPDGGDPVRYQRVSKFIDVFSDKSNLVKRDIRYAAKGSVKYAERLADLDIDDDRNDIDMLAERAAREAGKWLSADRGTALHALTEDYDNGYLQPDFTRLPDTPAVRELDRGPKAALAADLEVMRKDLLGYAALVQAYQIETIYAEATLVIDKYRVAGTADRFVKIKNPMNLPVDPDAEISVLDLKTGSVDFGRREKAMQLCCYAIADQYNHDTSERTPTGASQKYGYILHLPFGKGAGSLIPVKLEPEIAKLEKAFENWEERKSKHMWKHFGIDDWLTTQIETAASLDDLKDLYFRTSSYWTKAHSDLASARF